MCQVKTNSLGMTGPSSEKGNVPQEDLRLKLTRKQSWT